MWKYVCVKADDKPVFAHLIHNGKRKKKVQFNYYFYLKFSKRTFFLLPTLTMEQEHTKAVELRITHSMEGWLHKCFHPCSFQHLMYGSYVFIHCHLLIQCFYLPSLMYLHSLQCVLITFLLWLCEPISTERRGKKRETRCVVSIEE